MMLYFMGENKTNQHFNPQFFHQIYRFYLGIYPANSEMLSFSPTKQLLSDNNGQRNSAHRHIPLKFGKLRKIHENNLLKLKTN